MPSRRHGLAFDPIRKIPIVHFGFVNLFSNFTRYRLSSATQSELGTIAQDRDGLDWHFKTVARRLVRALDAVQRRALEAEYHFNRDPGTEDAHAQWNNGEELAIAMDQLFHYLAIVADAIGRLVGRTIASINMSPRDLESYVKTVDSKKDFLTIYHTCKTVRERAIQDTSLHALSAALDEISTPQSWWTVAFQYGSGTRQRLVHYPDIFRVQGSKGDNDQKFSAHVYLNDISRKRQSVDVLAQLAPMMLDFCSWLDAMERELTSLLGLNLSVPPFALFPPLDRQPMSIPSSFLYLPVVDGSAPIPESVRTGIDR